ncbi:hypothetical protein [Azohydromonas australica]|nr:hypothetical protein [Azohydromonas australica]
MDVASLREANANIKRVPDIGQIASLEANDMARRELDAFVERVAHQHSH